MKYVSQTPSSWSKKAQNVHKRADFCSGNGCPPCPFKFSIVHWLDDPTPRDGPLATLSGTMQREGNWGGLWAYVRVNNYMMWCQCNVMSILLWTGMNLKTWSHPNIKVLSQKIPFPHRNINKHGTNHEHRTRTLNTESVVDTDTLFWWRGWVAVRFTFSHMNRGFIKGFHWHWHFVTLFENQKNSRVMAIGYDRLHQRVPRIQILNILTYHT